MIWKLSCLLVFLAVFAKHGEAYYKMLSIHGDINSAMFDTALQSSDVVGFLYDDSNGGFSLNKSFCYSENSGSQAFSVQSDCTVQAGIGFSEDPTKRSYLMRRELDFPEPSTGANLVVAKREEGSPFGRHVTTRSRVAVNMKNILRYPSKQNSKIYCNDKDHKAMKPLFDFDNEHKGRIMFRKNGRFYERKMKCVAILKDAKRFLMTAKLFTLIISNAPENQLKFLSRDMENGALQYTPNSPESHVMAMTDTSQSELETMYVFRADAVSGCKATITPEMQEEKQPIVQFTYDHKTYNMPAIRAEATLDCGIARIGSGLPVEMNFGYWCDCKNIP